MAHIKMNWRRICIISLYRILSWLLFPLLLLYFLRRVWRQRDYARNLRERFGLLPGEIRQSAHGSIWIHAVSVGEIVSSAGLIRELRRQFPLAPVYVSVTTVAGRRVAEQKLAGITDGIFYAPVDYPFAIRSVLRRLKPIVVVILETEIWPCLYHETKKTLAGLIVVNGRISAPALRRYRKARWLFSEVLSMPDMILTQDAVSRDRFATLMKNTTHLSVGGNVKYDHDVAATAAPEAVVRFLQDLGPKRVWVAASTMPPAKEGDVDEDDLVIETFATLKETFKDLLLILVPRRPERFERAAVQLEAAGVRWIRRTTLQEVSHLQLPGVLLLDTMGELAGLFRYADVVFMGGTMNHRGGHNILEPAFAGKSIVMGPHMENFPEIAQDFLRKEAALQVSHGQELTDVVRALLVDPAYRDSLGRRALEQSQSGRGATQRYVSAIGDLFKWSTPRDPRSWWHYAIHWPLSRIWAAGTAAMQRRYEGKENNLPLPVLSVGNITVGGAGKTPTVLWLADAMRRRGHRPAILTRGYRRVGRDPFVIAGPGEKRPRSSTGDEAQIFLQRSQSPVGIGADRYTTGLELLERFSVDLFLLDDGFQHWRLARDFNLVLIDALTPFGGRDMVPLGRLREPLSSLKRADAILLTRCDSPARLAGIESIIRGVNPLVPVFRSRIEPMAWVDAASGAEFPIDSDPGAPEAKGDEHSPSSPSLNLPGARVAAFCGLANPNSFRQTLRTLHIRTASFWAFGDHHVYTPSQLQRLEENAQHMNASVLVTTEKDFHNLEPDWYLSIRQMPLYWLKIGTEIERGEALVDLLEERIHRKRASRETV